jgi:hypothetical protein
MAQKSAPPRLDLSNMSRWGRNTIKYGIILIILFIVGRFALMTGIQIYKTLNPPPPAPPTMGFGRIPAPAFPAQLPGDRPSTIRLETVGQRLPNYGIKAEVYFMPSAQPNLLALDRAKQQAATLGFVFEPEKVSNTNYRWRRTQPLPAILEIDTVYSTFDLEADWASSVTLLENTIIPDQRQASSELRTLLRSLTLLNTDVATAEPRLTYLKALAGETRPAESLSEADFTLLNLYRNTANSFPTVTSIAGQGVIQLLLSGSREQGERILEFHSDYLPVDWTSAETYPLITGTEAWQLLQSGQGYVTSKGTGDTATVRTVYLAYYEPFRPQNYFQPVYVFEGDGGFQALVPALNPQVYQIEE